MRNKKGATNLFSLVTIIIVLVIAAIAAMIGLSILSSVTKTSCNDGGFYWNATTSLCQLNASAGGALPGSTVTTNATVNAGKGISNITSQFGNIGLVAAAVIIIGLLVGGFVFLFRRKGSSM